MSTQEPQHRYRKYLIACMIAGSFVGICKIISDMPERMICNDFAVHYLSSRIFIEGDSPYGVPLKPYYEANGFEFDGVITTATNPPTLLTFFSLFCLSTPLVGYTSWLLFQTGCLLLVLAMLKRTLFQNDWYRWCVLVTLLLVSKPLITHYQYAQVQLFLTALVYGGFFMLQRGRYWTGCGLVAFAGVIKLYPLVMLPWFLMQGDDPLKTKVLRGAVMVAGVFGACLSFGPSMWIEFHQSAMPLITVMAGYYPSNNSLPAFISQLYLATHLQLPGPGVRLLATASGLSIIAIAYALCMFRGRRPKSPDEKTGPFVREGRVSEAEFSLLLLAMIAGSMTAWMHYYVFLLFPLAWLSRELSQFSRWVTAAFWGAIATIVLAIELESGSLLLMALVGSMPLFAVLIFYGLVAQRLSSQLNIRQTVHELRCLVTGSGAVVSPE